MRKRGLFIIHYCYLKMAKEMNVSCDFIERKLECILPENTIDVLLKVRTRLGEHTFREDVYTRTLKYRRWNNQLRPFHSLKQRVADIFRKRISFSDSSKSTSMQTVMNNTQCKTEEKDSETDSDIGSVHSNWSDVMPIEKNNSVDTVLDIPKRKRTVRNIVLVPYKPKPKDWGSWKVKSPYTTSTVASPIPEDNSDVQNSEGKLTYVPHSPYYEPVRSPQFYGDE